MFIPPVSESGIMDELEEVMIQDLAVRAYTAFAIAMHGGDSPVVEFHRLPGNMQSAWRTAAETIWKHLTKEQ